MKIIHFIKYLYHCKTKNKRVGWLGFNGTFNTE